jgi:hypothetical protein
LRAARMAGRMSVSPVTTTMVSHVSDSASSMMRMAVEPVHQERDSPHGAGAEKPPGPWPEGGWVSEHPGEMETSRCPGAESITVAVVVNVAAGGVA